MKIASALLAALLVSSSAFAKSRPDALTLLKNATQRYADAKSYHIEAVQERTSTNALDRNWQRELLVAIVAPEGRYRYEGKSGHGSGILISDGKMHWAYHLDEHLYTQMSASAAQNEKNRIIPMEEMAALDAKRLVMGITTLLSQVKSASFLPDQKIELNGHKTKCYVVQIGENDFRTRRSGVKIEETLWIDQSNQTIVKRQRREDSYSMLPPSGVHIPMRIEETTVYPVVRLGEEEPSSSFAFAMPSDAKLVESFPDTMMHAPHGEHGEDLVGKQAPDIQLKAVGGKPTNLSAFRGKPVFIEFWATWCGPCVELMPELKRLYSGTSKSVIWLSIDSDEDPSAAATYLSQEHISWPNYHDGDGSLGKAFGRNGIPLGVLIDAEGKVTFYKAGYEIVELQAAMAKLSPPLQGVAASGVPQSK